jgi:hypothetical protein
MSVVPFLINAHIKIAGPVSSHLVFHGDDEGKMLGVFMASVLDPKSSTTRENMTGWVECLKRPGV